MKNGMRLGAAALAALLMAGTGAASAAAQGGTDGPRDVIVYAPGDENTVVVGNDNNVAGRDNAVGSGHTTGTGHVVTSEGDEVAGPVPAKPYGTVISPIGVVLRERPTTNSARVGHPLVHGERVGLKCQTVGQNVDGNNIWFKLRYRDQHWVAARYVENTGLVPDCT